MRRAELTRGGAALALAWALGACVSTSIESDLTTVRALAHAEALPKLPEDDVAESPGEDSRAQLARALDVETAVRIALRENRALRAKLRELGVARAALAQAGAVANPVVGAELPPERDADVELRVEYRISSLLTAGARADAADADLERARLDAAAATVALGHDVRAAFFALQAAEQRLALGQQALDARAASRDAAVAVQQAGNAPALDAARRIAAYERARIGVAELELSRAHARERLVRVLSVHGTDAALRTTGPLADAPETLPDLEHIETRAVEASLQLKASRARLEALARGSAAARAEGLIPDITLDARARHASDAARAAEPAEDPWSFGAGVNVELPLFDRGQGATLAHAAMFDAELERYHGLAVDVRSAARDAAAELESAAARAHQYARVIIPAQQLVLDEVLLQYDAMQLGVQELLRAQGELLDARLAHVEVLRQYWTARAAVDALLRGHVVHATEPATGVASIDGSGMPDAQGGH